MIHEKRISTHVPAGNRRGKREDGGAGEKGKEILFTFPSTNQTRLLMQNLLTLPRFDLGIIFTQSENTACTVVPGRKYAPLRSKNDEG